MAKRPLLGQGDGVGIRWMRVALRAVLGVLAAFFLVWMVLYVTKGRFLKAPFERIASRALDRKVEVDGDFMLYFDPIAIRLFAERLSIANPPWAGTRPFFVARRIDSRIATLPLIFGTRRINRLRLEGGALDLRWDAAGRRNSWTFDSPGPQEPLDLPTIRRALIYGSRLHYRDPRMQLVADLKFDTIRAQDTRFASDVRFTGQGRLRSRPFTVIGSLLSPDETVAGGQNHFTLRADGADNRLDVAGTLPGATELEGSDLMVRARGSNLARLFDFLGAAVPDTRRYRFTSHLTKAGEEWHFRRLYGGFGASDLAGSLTISMPRNRLLLVADLVSQSVDIVDLGPFIGYDPQRLATQGGKGAVTKVAGVPRVLPDAPLRAEALQGFDARVKYRIRDIRAPHLPVSNVELGLDLTRGLLSLSPLSFDVVRGHLSSDIIIDSRARPVLTDYDIRLAPTPMGRLLAGWGVEESGTTGVVRARVKLRGRGDTVHDSLAQSDGRIAIVLPKGTMWTRNVQLSELDIGTFITKMFAEKLEKPVEINCGLIAFTVRGGRAAADPILIDTTKNVIIGRGGFSFRDESLDLAMRADGKTFSLFSGQSPVGIEGHFAAPKLDVISPQLLARGGLGLGLGVAASPLAAVLAFIDPGDAKAADCGPVLAAARATAQRTAKGKPRQDVGTGAPKKKG